MPQLKREYVHQLRSAESALRETWPLASRSLGKLRVMYVLDSDSCSKLSFVSLEICEAVLTTASFFVPIGLEMKYLSESGWTDYGDLLRVYSGLLRRAL